MAKLLVRIGLIAQQDALAGLHKTDRTARAEQMRFQRRPGRYNAEQGHGGLDAATLSDLDRRHRTALRCGKDDLAPCLGLRQLLSDFSDAAFDVGDLRLRLEGQIIELTF